ncbi:MAG: ribbon-helix-helix domain-containing protein [Rhizobiaceae bacterium]
MVEAHRRAEFGQTSTEDFEPVYRAVTTRSGRHGIRLEKIYWRTLKRIADEDNRKIGELVEEISGLDTNNKNLTSALRVACLDWMAGRFQELEALYSDQMVRNIIYACPTSALALSTDKRLHSFNQPLLRLITDTFSVLDPEFIPARLRLIMDVQIDKLIEQLSANENRPIRVGIALGIDDRRMRSQLNVILAPSPARNVILGFLLP